MKKLPIGIQTFSELVDPVENNVYVDKTDIILNLIKNGKYYFLSRPRRFGKSVLLSTLDEIFSANQVLFKDLAIEHQWNWEVAYPVIRLSFGGGEFRTEALFDEVIRLNLLRNQKKLDIYCDKELSPGACFRELIISAYEHYQQKVVILIDEYDKPIIDVITDKELARFNRDKLKGLYGVMKDLDEYIKFVMITGVSKFAKLNLFSGLNNLEDITLDKRYSTLCGYTHSQVNEVFAEHLKGVDMEKLKRWYNGYNYFGEPVYNPFDILLFISKDKEYRNYWWSTGNPSFLIDKLKEQNYYLPELQNFIADDMLLESFDVDYIDLIALLWQTGYLTFAEKMTKRDQLVYRLKVPNREVQASLNGLFIDYLTNHKHQKMSQQDQLYDALEADNLEGFKQALSGLFASIPYHNYANNIIANYEGYYASVVYTYLASLGVPMVAEDTTNKGRIDLTLLMPNKIIIVEFKVDVKAGESMAIEQIKSKQYAEKYTLKKEPIYLLGIHFDSNDKNITAFEWEKYSA